MDGIYAQFSVYEWGIIRNAIRERILAVKNFKATLKAKYNDKSDERIDIFFWEIVKIQEKIEALMNDSHAQFSVYEWGIIRNAIRERIHTVENFTSGLQVKNDDEIGERMYILLSEIKEIHEKVKAVIEDELNNSDL